MLMASRNVYRNAGQLPKAEVVHETQPHKPFDMAGFPASLRPSAYFGILMVFILFKCWSLQFNGIRCLKHFFTSVLRQLGMGLGRRNLICAVSSLSVSVLLWL